MNHLNFTSPIDGDFSSATWLIDRSPIARADGSDSASLTDHQVKLVLAPTIRKEFMYIF